jgi:hypothetical protein
LERGASSSDFDETVFYLSLTSGRNQKVPCEGAVDDNVEVVVTSFSFTLKKRGVSGWSLVAGFAWYFFIQFRNSLMMGLF